MTLFRNQHDRLPVAILTGITLIDLTLYLWVQSVWILAAYWLVMFVPKGTMGAWSHHHQHCPTFKSTPLNRLLELIHALHTGMTTNLWVLHHVFGHHLNYLDQTKDESRWKYKDGRVMGPVAYTLSVTLTSYWRAYQVGKRFPEHRRNLVVFGALTLAVVATLVVLKPLAALFLFVLPMICSLTFVSWVTHDHHTGLDTQDPLQASYNVDHRWFNIMTGNLGYHTAHHLRQGVHWSQLPELHRTIEKDIPKHLYRQPGFLPGRGRLPAAVEAEPALAPEPHRA